jgi:hypothetical protein
MTSFCPLAKLSCKVDFKPFLLVWWVAMCLMADCLKGSQPNDLRFEFGLLVRQFSLAFLNCFLALAWVSLMA